MFAVWIESSQTSDPLGFTGARLRYRESQVESRWSFAGLQQFQSTQQDRIKRSAASDHCSSWDLWNGDPAVWRVEDGALVGESTKEKPLSDSYTSFRGFEAKDFDLKLEIKVESGGGSGIQYRSQTGLPWRRPTPSGKALPNLNWMMTGPQADFWFPVSPQQAEWPGHFYSENTPLGIIAFRGEAVNSSAGKKPRLVGNIGDRTALGGYVKSTTGSNT
jgi:hypothetical protein